MSADEQRTARSGVRLDVHGSGRASVQTGLPVLNSLLARLAEVAHFDLVLELEPDEAALEVEAAGDALGTALSGWLRAPGAAGWGAASLASSEALAHVVLEAADEPLLVSNVDLTDARIAGLETDVARSFLEHFAERAGLVLHLRLLNGTDTQHVLEAIFKALGAALSQACTTRGGES